MVHLKAVISMLPYLESVPGTGLFYHVTANMMLSGFADSDWATCPTSRKSMTRYTLYTNT